MTTVELPTAFWHELVFEFQRSGERLPACLRRVLTGTEQVLPERLAVWRELGIPLVHVFGLTEVTVTSMLHVVDPHGPFAPASAFSLLPVGRPFAGNRAYVLDRGMEPMPVGVMGEIYLAGTGLARGYLRSSADQTAARFVPSPWGEAGERLYRTGDLGRWLAVGDLEFLGRMDSQVKVRGFRIELGEIEASLAALPGIREAVAVARRFPSGDLRLVAYVVPDLEGFPKPGELRARLAGILPPYMVPSHFVTLQALPLTPSGKLDRRSLPAPQDAGLDSVSPVLPRTAVEELLMAIWRDVLEVEQAGIRDNFFELGGHSLLATRVVSQLRNTFQVEISLRELFENPTVAGLAGKVEEALRGGSGVEAPPIEPVDRARNLPLSFAQQRLWFIDRMEPGTALYNVPIALRTRGELSIPVLERTFGEVVRRHEVLRTVFAEEGGGRGR